MISSSSIQSKLVFWSELHALLMLAASFIILIGFPVWIVAGFGVLSFAGLIVSCQTHWTPRKNFGVANFVTLFRLIAASSLLIFPIGDSTLVVICALIVFVLDAVDGKLARKYGLDSLFGEYFDKEVDAFFMLALCILLYIGDRLAVWILLPGLLRYCFVLFIKFCKPRQVKEQRTTKGKWIYFFMVSSLISCFLPFPQLTPPITAWMTVMLVYSFSDSAWNLYRSQ